MAATAVAPLPLPLPLAIDVVSDNICPFCFIGLRKLQLALAASPYVAGARSRSRSAQPAPTFAPTITFHPFQLDPTLPKDKPVALREHYLRKIGPHFAQMELMKVKRGKEVGINFASDGPVRHTKLSHRLLSKALQHGGWELQYKLIEELFPAYFEQAQDIGNPATLARLAVRTGVFPDEAQARAFLDSDELADEVERGFDEARAKNISGVPHFTITALKPNEDADVTATGSGTYRPFLRSQVSGAQDPEVFVTLIETMAKKAAEKGLTTGAASANDDASTGTPAVAEGASCAIGGGKTC